MSLQGIFLKTNSIEDATVAKNEKILNFISHLNSSQNLPLKGRLGTGPLSNHYAIFR